MARRLQFKKRPSSSAPAPAANSISFFGTTIPVGVLIRALLIAAAVFVIYLPAMNGGPVLDDDWYYTNNPLVRGVAGLWKFWFQPGSWVEYYPIHETVMWVQWQLWGANSLGYHLTNVVLHIVNAWLFWRLLSRLDLRWAWVGGLLFAVHPVAVDSVANMAELKNTLSLLPLLLASIAWIDFDRAGGNSTYWRALGWFVVAMLCKIAVAPFPVMLLLFAWWKRSRISWSDVRASLPFFVVAVGIGLMTPLASSLYNASFHPQDLPIPMGGPFEHLARAGMILGYYFAVCVLPLGLAPMYPKWTTDAGNLFSYLPWIVVVAIIIIAWWRRQTWGRHALLGLGFFLLGMAPYLGIKAISYLYDSWVEIHLLYFPMLGLIGLVVAFLGDIEMKLPASFRPGLTAIVGLIVILLGVEAHGYAGWFSSAETLWTKTLNQYPQLWIARYNLGSTLLAQQRNAEALPLLEAAMEQEPGYADGHDNLGFALDRLGYHDQAVAQFNVSLQLNPIDAQALLFLGEVAVHERRLADVQAYVQRGLAGSPNDPALISDMADLLFQSGKVDEAIDLYRKVVPENPDMTQLQYNFGYALLQSGAVPEGAEHLARAVQLDPSLIPAHENLGVALARLGHLPEAIEQFEAVLALDPKNNRARVNLGMALFSAGHAQEGTEQIEKALELDPNDAVARATLQKMQSLPLNNAVGN